MRIVRLLATLKSSRVNQTHEEKIAILLTTPSSEAVT